MLAIIADKEYAKERKPSTNGNELKFPDIISIPTPIPPNANHPRKSVITVIFVGLLILCHLTLTACEPSVWFREPVLVNKRSMI